MKNLKNKKGFTLVELLAVIVVLAIVMGLAVVGITSVLENTRKSAFASDAKSYIQGARGLVSSDQANALLGVSATYSPSCVTGGTKYIPIELIPLDQGGKSPYGILYSKGTATTTSNSAVNTSYVKVVASVANGNCTLSYSIFLTDTVKRIGAKGSEIAEDVISGNSVLNV